MENLLTKEGELREKKAEIVKELGPINPISEEEKCMYDMIVYTDGACHRKDGEPLGFAAFIIKV